MTCRELAELLIDYIQGDLEPEIHQHISRHISLCPPCEAFVATYRITIQMTRQLPPAPMPPELAERLKAVLREGGSGESQ